MTLQRFLIIQLINQCLLLLNVKENVVKSVPSLIYGKFSHVLSQAVEFHSFVEYGMEKYSIPYRSS